MVHSLLEIDTPIPAKARIVWYILTGNALSTGILPNRWENCYDKVP
jgi:hypothetical protein